MHFHTHRHDDILTVLRLQKEFGFRVVLIMFPKAWKVADEIATVKGSGVDYSIDSPGGKLETMDIATQTARRLEKAGALWSVFTPTIILPIRAVFYARRLCRPRGMSREKALYG